MTHTALTGDLRVRLFALVAVALNFVESLVERLRDTLNGDVAKVLGSFEPKIERARMVAVKAANKIDTQIEALEAQVEALEGQYDGHLEAAARAARVQERIAKLLS